MTWYYSISEDGQEMDVYEDDPEFTGLIKTVSNDGTGWDFPEDVTPVMRETWEKEASLGSSPVMTVRAGHILMDLATENIEEGTP